MNTGFIEIRDNISNGNCPPDYRARMANRNFDVGGEPDFAFAYLIVHKNSTPESPLYDGHIVGRRVDKSIVAGLKVESLNIEEKLNCD